MWGEVGSNRSPWQNCCVTRAARRSIVLLVSGADRDPVLRTSDVAVPAAAAAGQCPSRTLAPSPTPLPLLGSHANRQIGQFREELAKAKNSNFGPCSPVVQSYLVTGQFGKSHFYARSTHALLPSCIKIIYANLHLVKTA